MPPRTNNDSDAPPKAPAKTTATDKPARPPARPANAAKNGAKSGASKGTASKTSTNGAAGNGSKPPTKTTRSRKAPLLAEANVSDNVGIRKLGSSNGRVHLTELKATIPVVIPPGARSPVDDIVEVLLSEVIGQDRAIDAIARALLRSRE